MRKSTIEVFQKINLSGLICGSYPKEGKKVTEDPIGTVSRSMYFGARKGHGYREIIHSFVASYTYK